MLLPVLFWQETKMEGKKRQGSYAQNVLMRLICQLVNYKLQKLFVYLLLRLKTEHSHYGYN